MVSVIMAARDASGTVGAAIGALLAGTYDPDRLEVIVAEGGSTDDTALVLHALARNDARIRVVGNPSGTTPNGLNRALAQAEGEVIVRIDAHTLPAPDYVERCVAALEESGAEVVGGYLQPVGEGPFGEAVALAMSSAFGGGPAHFRRAPAESAGEVDTVYLGAWRRATLETHGGFDPAFRTNQDYELCRRISDAGGRVRLDPRIRSVTLVRADARSLARQYYGYGLGRARTVRKHPHSLGPRQVVPATAVGAVLVAAGLAPLSSKWRRLAAAGGLIYSVTAATAARRAGPNGDAGLWARTVLAYGLMHVPWTVGFWVGLLAPRGDGGSGR
jgi:glycosyltransferase involved in cell wall biosynthesis